MNSLSTSMSQTFLEDIPEFLEIQRDSFLRILDTGLIEAFDKINPIAPTSQSKYGLLFYPKEYVLVLPENTITEAFLQGKTYGCKIYVPAVIYDIENSSIAKKTIVVKLKKQRFKFLKPLGFQKTAGSRFSEEILFDFQESSSNISVRNLISDSSVKKSKLSLVKCNRVGIASYSFFLPLLLGIERSGKKKTSSLSKIHENTPSKESFKKTNSSFWNNAFFFEKKSILLNLDQRRKKWQSYSFNKNQPKPINWLYNTFGGSIQNNTNSGLFTNTNPIKNLEVENLEEKDQAKIFMNKPSSLTNINSFKSDYFYKNLHHLIKKVDENSSLVLSLQTAQKQKKKLTHFSSSFLPIKFEKENYILPKPIQQKSKLGFFDKAPMWLRGRSNSSLIGEALEKNLLLETSLKFLTVKKKKRNSNNWFVPFSKRCLIDLKKEENTDLLESSHKLAVNLKLKSLVGARPQSSKEWVCIGVLPLMTPRGHFIINGSHRIIISQMARAPGLYYQTGEKLQATIVPSKGAWLRINVKASDAGEIKVWVRITPQRKMPYKIFIETYKYLENSKAIVNTGGSKFLNLVYKTLNSKIKHLDKHYAIGVVSGQISRTLFNPVSYSLGSLGRKRLNERLGINDKNGYLTSKDISIIKDNLLKLLGQKSNNLSADDIDHLENRRVRTCGELLQVEIETGMTRLKKAIGKQLDEYSNPDSSIFNTFNILHTKNTQNKQKKGNYFFSSKDSFGSELPSISFFEKKTALLEDEVKLYKKNLNNQQNFWDLYSLISEHHILFFNKKSNLFWKKNQNLFFLKKRLSILSSLKSSKILSKKSKLVLDFFEPNKLGTSLAFARLCKRKGSIYDIPKKVKDNWRSKFFFDKSSSQNKTFSHFPKENFISPSKIIGTKAFAGALREFFGSNPLSQYMDQTNPLAEITHKRRLSSLGPGGVDRASAGIAIRGIHPSHYGRICPIETPEGKNAGLVNSMTMWARVNAEGFLETPYFKVNGGSLMSQTSSLIPQWNFLSTKKESKQALKIVSSDLKISQSAFLPSIALPTRDGSERSFGRHKRDYVQFCGISPMQNISVATSLIPFLEHDDATRALMGSNMQRQAVPLLKATAPLIRTGLEGKVVGESGHALQAASSGIISTATRTFVSIDFFDTTQKTVSETQTGLLSSEKDNKKTNISLLDCLGFSIGNKQSCAKQKFIGNSKNLPFLEELLDFSTQSFNVLPPNIKKNKTLVSSTFFSFIDPKNKVQENLSPILRSKINRYLNKKSSVTVKNALKKQSLLLEKILFLSKYHNLSTPTFTKNLWRESSKITRHRKIHDLQQYTRSNQATVCVQRPAASEGRWVQKGDLIGDCSASKNGVLSLGQNIVVAYLPMEGFNFEDAIVVSDRLVHEELYTSVHVQRVEFDMDALVKKYIPRKIKVKKQKSAYKTNNQDWITFYNPHLLQSEKQNLNPLGIIKVGSWVGPGDVLVSKVFPVERKIAPSRHLLAAVFQEKKTKILDTDDTSVRVPKGIHGRVINVKIIGAGKTISGHLAQSCAFGPQVCRSHRKKKGQNKVFSILGQANNPIKKVASRTSTTLVNGELIDKVDAEKIKNSLLALEQFSLANKVTFFDQTRVPYFNQPKLITEDRQERESPSVSVGTPHFVRCKDHGTTCLSLEYQARKIKITNSLSRCSLEQIFNFGTLPLFPEQYASFFRLKNSPEQKDFILKKESTGLLTQTNLFEQQIFPEDRNKLLGKIRFTPFTKIFVYLKAKEQAANIGSRKLPYKIINNYIGSENNPSPSLIRKIFKELTNFAPINQVLVKPTMLNSNSFNNSGLQTEQTNSFENVKDLKETTVNRSSNTFVKDKNKENLLDLTRKKRVNETSLPISELKNQSLKKSINSQEYKITGVRIYIAERKKLQVGDKMSGRHGNKGIVSTILPREDMPYLPDGTPVDMVLNPLGIPSRMNVGQVFECLLGLAASMCDKSIGHTPFDEMYGPEASRSLVYLFLYVSRLRSRADWIFQPNFPGKTLLFDGRTGTPFEQWVTVGRAYMLKLIHMVDEKIHARSIGPRSLVTQQPVKGRARGGGQRLGEMEIWALEGFGAAYTLQEILTIKSDDIKGREDVESSIISATALSSHIPETFRITLFELRCLCLNLELNQNF